MPRWRTIVLGLGTAAGTVALVQAAEPALDIRPGLWEMTTGGGTAGGPAVPPDALAKLPPQQRAQVEAAMGQAGKPRVTRSCVTRRQLETGPSFGQSEHMSCRRTVLKRSAGALDMRLECTGEGQQRTTSSFHFAAPTPETLAGTVEVAMQSGPNATTSNQNVQGRWLGPDCGNVKPSE
jgi:hypothetical protein